MERGTRRQRDGQKRSRKTAVQSSTEWERPSVPSEPGVGASVEASPMVAARNGATTVYCDFVMAPSRQCKAPPSCAS